VLHSVINPQNEDTMTREQEKQVSKARREQRTDKQYQTQYSEQAVRAQREANQDYGFKFRNQEGR
jgi:hypothetical protein